MEEDKRDLISREISKFRDTHKVVFLVFLLDTNLDFLQNPKQTDKKKKKINLTLEYNLSAFYRLINI